MDHKHAYTEVMQRLRRFRTRRKLVHFAENASLLLLGALLAATVMPLVYSLGQHDTVFRWLLTAAAGATLAYFGYRLLLRPAADLLLFRQTPALDKTALEVGRKFPDIRDNLSNAFQLVEALPAAQGQSSDLTWAAFATVHEQVRELDFQRAVDARKTRRHALWLFGAALLFAAAYSLFPGHYSRAFALLANPDRDPARVARSIDVNPGDSEVIRGDALTISATISGTEPANVELVTSFGNGEFFERHPMARQAGGSFRHTVEQITEGFTYQILASDKLRSDRYRVTVIEMPEVIDLRVTLDSPAYTRLPQQQLDPNVGNISALPGTRATVRVRTNKDVESAQLRFQSGDSLAFASQNGELETAFTVRQPATYSIRLRDGRGLTNRNPIVYQINVLQDQSPVVEIVFPGEDVDLDESMKVPITISGEDDFGFSKLLLAYEVIPGGIETQATQSSLAVPFNASDGKLQGNMLWDLLDLMLLPDDAVEYWAELYDNDTVNGPKMARSQKYRLRYPSVQEIFNESAQQQQEAVQEFEEMLERSKTMRENLSTILQEVRREGKVDWQDEQKLKESLETQQEFYDKLEAFQQKLDEMVDKMERNDMLTMETIQKYNELQQMLEEIATPELKKMMEELQQAMEKLDPQQIQKALENMEFSQEQFLKNIEKTINLLKQLQAEQRLEEAIRAAEEMLQQQDAINQELQEQQDAGKMNELAQKQAEQNERLGDLEHALEDLQQKMQDLPQMQLPQEKIDQAQELAQSDAMQTPMQQMQQQLRQNQRQQARQSGQQLSEQLQQMERLLKSAQEQMQQNQKSTVMQALQHGSRNLLRLSKRQERLSQQAGGQSQATTDYNRLADDQNDVMSGTQRTIEQLFELSQQSFFMPPDVARQLGQSLQDMQSSLKMLEGQQGRQAAQAQGRAMQSLDGAVASLRQAMNSLNQAGGSGMGMEEMMQRLLGISNEQQGLNQQTQGMQNQGGLSMQQQAALSRLAAQQEALRKSMQELAQEFGSRQEILGSLDKIAEEMGEVVGDMENRNVNRETIERQQRILSRLLDAQKSVQERDYSRQRRAETGKQYMATDPGRLPENLGEAKNKIHQDLLRALREDYAKDYKLLIQKYFDALTRELQQQDKANQR